MYDCKLFQYSISIQCKKKLFISTGYTNIKSLATLCQEYQVDWLSDRIENYLSHAKIFGTDLLLEYMQLSKNMNFKFEVVTNLLNQFSDHFPKIQSSPLFVSVDRHIQILVARKRLFYLLEGIDQNIKTTFLNKEDFGLLSIFKDLYQSFIRFNFNSVELEEIKKHKKSTLAVVNTTTKSAVINTTSSRAPFGSSTQSTFGGFSFGCAQ